MKKYNILGDQMKIILKVFLFVLLFFLFIVLLIGFIALGCWLLHYMFTEAQRIKGKSLIGALVLVIFGGYYILKMFYALIKSLIPKRFVSKDFTKVEESNQLKLYKLVSEVAKETSCNMPNKICLSFDGDVSISFSGFLGRHKSLHIGVLALSILNVSELKTVIAHEFGHYIHRQSLLTRIVDYIHRTIFNMLYSDSSFEKSSGNKSIVFYGFERMVSFFYKILYRMIWKDYLEIERELEYRADRFAATFYDKSSLVSAIYKLKYGSEIKYFVDGIFKSHTNPYIYNYYSFFHKCLSAFSSDYTCKKYLDKSPDTIYIPQSKLNIEEIKDTHPNIKERIDQLSSLPVVDSPIDGNLCLSLLVDSTNLLSTITSKLIKVPEEKSKPMTDAEVDKVIMGAFSMENYIPSIFAISLPELSDYTNIINTNDIDYPWREDNLHLIYDYQRAKDDESLLNNIKSLNLPSIYFKYNGVEYKLSSKEPVEQHKQYLLGLGARLEHFYTSVLKFLCYNYPTMAEDIVRRYKNLVIFMERVENSKYLAELMNQTTDFINGTKRFDKETITELCSNARSYENYLKNDVCRDLIEYFSLEDNNEVMSLLNDESSFPDKFNVERYNRILSVNRQMMFLLSIELFNERRFFIELAEDSVNVV